MLHRSNPALHIHDTALLATTRARRESRTLTLQHMAAIDWHLAKYSPDTASLSYSCLDYAHTMYIDIVMSGLCAYTVYIDTLPLLLDLENPENFIAESMVYTSAIVNSRTISFSVCFCLYINSIIVDLFKISNS